MKTQNKTNVLEQLTPYASGNVLRRHFLQRSFLLARPCMCQLKMTPLLQKLESLPLRQLHTSLKMIETIDAWSTGSLMTNGRMTK